MKINPIRGTHDLFGAEIEKFNRVISEVKHNAQKFGFNEIITPIFESWSLISWFSCASFSICSFSVADKSAIFSSNGIPSSSSSGSSGTRCVIGKTHAWGHTVMNCN